VRPRLRRHRRRARIELHGRAPGRLVRHPTTSPERNLVTTVSPDLDLRFRDAAARESLLDVAYDLVDTPIGTLLVAATERGVCRIAYDAEPERELETLARAFGLRVLRSARPIDPARTQLDEYFEGKRQRFDLAVDLALQADFNRRVLRELARVPYGEVVTYGELAARSARPRAA